MRFERTCHGWLWNPWTTLDEARRELDRNERLLRVGTRDAGSAVPVDVYDGGDHFVVKANLPGVAPADVEVSVGDDRILSIRARRPEADSSGEDYLCCERLAGRLARTIELPVAVDTGHVTATLRQGVLEIRLPKSPAVAVKKVTIAAA